MWTMTWHTVDASSQIATITTHLFITMCILIMSSVNNSLAEEVGAANGPNLSNEDDPLQHIDQSTDNREDDRHNCWITEAYEIRGPCQPCNQYRMKLPGDCCGETGYRQKIFCKISEKEEFMSCRGSRWDIEKKFWTFESVMFAVAMISGFIAILRRRKLDCEALDRVRRQIANSV